MLLVTIGKAGTFHLQAVAMVCLFALLVAPAFVSGEGASQDYYGLRDDDFVTDSSGAVHYTVNYDEILSRSQNESQEDPTAYL